MLVVLLPTIVSFNLMQDAGAFYQARAGSVMPVSSGWRGRGGSGEMVQFPGGQKGSVGEGSGTLLWRDRERDLEGNYLVS